MAEEIPTPPPDPPQESGLGLKQFISYFVPVLVYIGAAILLLKACGVSYNG